MRAVSGKANRRCTVQSSGLAVALLPVGLVLACDVETLPPEEEELLVVTPCEMGKADIYPCERLDLVARVELGDSGIVNDLWGWTDPVTGVEWVLAGHSDGTYFISLENPDEPLLLGFLRRTADSRSTLWRDIKVYRDHAYIVSDLAGEHGMQVFDLRLLRGTDAYRNFSPTYTYDEVHSAHNIAINEETGFAFATGMSSGGTTCGSGLHMVDLSSPAEPEFAGCFSYTGAGRGYTHDAQCVVYRGPDTAYRGAEICLGANEVVLSIADVTDKESPVAIGSGDYPDVGYLHQGWLDAEHVYFYTNDELDEFRGRRTRTLVWDVRDLNDPFVVAEHIHETSASDHNLYVAGDRMYQSNYGAGLRVFDISDRESPVEIAFFDTDPGIDEEVPGLNGSWSNYPFFASGIIAVTSMDGGVFLLLPSELRPE